MTTAPRKPPAQHCADARKLLASLDAELARESKAKGEQLVWTPAELESLSMLAKTVDRRHQMRLALKRIKPDDRKSFVSYSTELRLLDATVGRLLKELSFEEPAPMTLRQVKAQRASNIRWARATAAGE